MALADILNTNPQDFVMEPTPILCNTLNQTLPTPPTPRRCWRRSRTMTKKPRMCVSITSLAFQNNFSVTSSTPSKTMIKSQNFPPAIVLCDGPERLAEVPEHREQPREPRRVGGLVRGRRQPQQRPGGDEGGLPAAGEDGPESG